MILNETWIQAGEAAVDVVEKIRLAKSRKRVFADLHEKLKIPEGYYKMQMSEARIPQVNRFRYEPPVPPLSNRDRSDAVTALVAAREIEDGSPDAIMAAICGRLAKLK
jgi:hypothetical protein